MTDTDPTLYHSPRFDVSGFPVRPYTVKTSEAPSLPHHWTLVPQTATRNDLLLKRKKEFIPNNTYDIDGDGFVDHKDMALAKMFDRNNDGILDSAEKELMNHAISLGLMENYIWGLDQTGPTRHHRLIQKEGKVIGEHYQKNSLDSAAELKSKTCKDLKHKLKEESKTKGEEILKKWFDKNPNKIDYVPYRVYSEPEFRTLAEKKQRIKDSARKDNGLLPQADIKDYSKAPNYKYIETPAVSGFQEFKSTRKQQMLKLLHESKNYNHVSREQNFNERESRFIHIIPENSDLKTSTKLSEKRKKEINDYNLKTFSNPSIGIHGNELPKFKDNLQEFWKLKQDYLEVPEVSTRRQLINSRKSTGQVIRESRFEEEKPERKLQIKPKSKVTEKVGHEKTEGKFEAFEMNEFKKIESAKHEYRRSTIFGYFLSTGDVSGAKTEVVKTFRKKESRESAYNVNVAENISPGMSSLGNFKTKTLVKRQGTSARILRSRGFIS